MINLLPPAYTDKVRFSRKNKLLLRWAVWVGTANLGLILILLFGWVYIDRQSSNIESQIAASEHQLKTQNLTEVEKQSQQISNNVKTINQVLSKQVQFSQLIQETGRVIPAGAVLGMVSLTEVGGSIDLTVSTRDHASAIQVAANLNDPKNNLFEKVDVVNVTCNNSSPAYPCTATFKALFNKNAKERFLKTASGSRQ